LSRGKLLSTGWRTKSYCFHSYFITKNRKRVIPSYFLNCITSHLSYLQKKLEIEKKKNPILKISLWYFIALNGSKKKKLNLGKERGPKKCIVSGL